MDEAEENPALLASLYIDTALLTKVTRWTMCMSESMKSVSACALFLFLTGSFLSCGSSKSDETQARTEYYYVE
jgi:hypothetical protein